MSEIFTPRQIPGIGCGAPVNCYFAAKCLERGILGDELCIAQENPNEEANKRLRVLSKSHLCVNASQQRTEILVFLGEPVEPNGDIDLPLDKTDQPFDPGI